MGIESSHKTQRWQFAFSKQLWRSFQGRGVVTQPLLNGNCQDNFLQAGRGLQELTVGIMYLPVSNAHCQAGTPRLLSQNLNAQSWCQGWMDQAHINAEELSPPDQTAAPKCFHHHSLKQSFICFICLFPTAPRSAKLLKSWFYGALMKILESPCIPPSASCGLGSRVRSWGPQGGEQGLLPAHPQGSCGLTAPPFKPIFSKASQLIWFRW